MTTAYLGTPAFKNATNDLGFTQPGTVDTVKMVPLGTVKTFTDPLYGTGEFIYLQGVASTAAGDAVVYDTAFVTVRAAATNSDACAWAFATGATVANTYGWYCIGGMFPGNKTKTVSMAAGITVGVSTAGLISASSSLKELLGVVVAIVASATTTTNNGGKVTLMLNRPHGQGRIT
jgi:hypothetical protein